MALPVWYCPICKLEGPDGSVKLCPNDGVQVKTISKMGAEWLGKTVGGKYCINRFANAGGVDDIFVGRNIDTGQKLSIKLVHSGLDEISDIDKAVAEEVQQAFGIKHHNLVELVDFGRLEGGGYFVVMEALFGISLADALQLGRLSSRMAIKLVTQACEGLAAAHAEGVFHRDLKPENLFLQDIGPESDPLLKLLELGFSKLRGTGAARTLAPEGAPAGTPAYMAPEQCQGQPGGQGADIYALGVMLFEMLLGHRPFDDPSPITVLTQHVTGEVVWDRELAHQRNVPAEAELVVMRALSKKPGDRQESVVALKRDLDVLQSRLLRGSRYSRHVASPVAVSVPTQPEKRFSVVSLVEGSGVDGEIVEIAPQVYWVGRRHGVRLECNAFLRIFRGADAEVSMLFYTGPPLEQEMVQKKVETLIGSLDQLDYIVLGHWGPQMAGNAAAIQQASSKAQILCSEDTWRLAHFYGLDADRYTTTESFADGRMELATGHKLQVIPTSFCPVAGAVMFYDPASRVLFSSDLFSGTTTSDGFIAKRESLTGIELFHAIYMPNKEALADALKKAKALEPRPLILAPGQGSVVIDPLVDNIVTQLSRLDVGYGVTRSDEADSKYLQAANEMVRELSDIVGANETTQWLHDFRDGGSFNDLFKFKDSINISQFRVEPRIALELLFRDALSLAPMGQKSKVQMALGGALNRILSG